MINSNKFSDKKILLIDKEEKNKNDRTWCFWEKDAGCFESIVYKSWHGLHFISDHSDIALDISPYKYKMIRGIDFYDYCFNRIQTQSNITILHGEVSYLAENNFRPSLNGNMLNIQNAIVFNSIYIPSSSQKTSFHFKQHFKGWIIETDEPIFDPGNATLMDFRVDQSLGTTFVYVLPFSSNKALVEYTLFNKILMSSDEYDVQLKLYIERFLGSPRFKILEEEMGMIPMTSETFAGFKNGMFNIGTAGGQTKASTGYTFKFIQKQADSIVRQMLADQHPAKKNPTPKRFLFYDNTLLHILSEEQLPGKKIFEHLFRRNKASSVFKFLDNESSLSEELRIINSLPKKIFIQAGAKEFVRLFF